MSATTTDSAIPFARPDFGDEEISAVSEVLRSGWITTGPKAAEFEKRFADFVGARHAIAVSSGTAALHLAIEAAGVRAGDEVITTPYTFTASAEVIRYLGATPVFVDIDPVTFNIDASRVEGAIGRRAKAILPVHVGGLPADMERIGPIARKRGLRVVEDAAHALPSFHRGRMIGSIGDYTCFSFYATKTITTAEGGMLCTDDDEAAARCRMMSLHGIGRDAWKRYRADGDWYYEVLEAGFKYNMTDIAAALGLVQLAKANAMRERRLAIATRYSEAFRVQDTLEVPQEGAPGEHSWHLYMLRLNEDVLKVDRAAFIREIRARGIGASVHFIPLHLHPYYRDTFGLRPEDFPNATREYSRELSLPIYSKMTDAEVDRVIAVVSDVAVSKRR